MDGDSTTNSEADRLRFCEIQTVDIMHSETAEIEHVQRAGEKTDWCHYRVDYLESERESQREALQLVLPEKWHNISEQNQWPLFYR